MKKMIRYWLEGLISDEEFQAYLDRLEINTRKKKRAEKRW